VGHVRDAQIRKVTGHMLSGVARENLLVRGRQQRSCEGAGAAGASEQARAAINKIKKMRPRHPTEQDPIKLRVRARAKQAKTAAASVQKPRRNAAMMAQEPPTGRVRPAWAWGPAPKARVREARVRTWKAEKGSGSAVAEMAVMRRTWRSSTCSIAGRWGTRA
jgi:hypothetical protein